ncbi:ABC transporter ATP-binding protein, partial [Micrococcus terreus]|uniref:ABC transporter ATP-binding protein n=1 Tax=Micrococcus terreus TaxID=574650 RepID=UPI0030B8E6BC
HSADHTATEHPVEVRGLTHRFGNFTAVDDFDLTVAPGTVHGFLGPNGAGKSTTMRVLLGLYRPTAGQVRVLGHDPATHPAEVTRGISSVPGDVSLWPNLTGRQALDVLAGLRGHYDHAFESELIDRFALDPSKKVRSYSTGNRQKVMLVAAFAAQTPVLLLDEPTSGLDPLMEQEFGRCIREATADGRTVLLSSHLLAEVERLCTHVTIIRDGRLVESGQLQQMRHLAASTVTATLPASTATTTGSSPLGAHDAPARAEDAQALVARLTAAGLRLAGPDDGPSPASETSPQPVRIAGAVDRANVPAVLGILAAAGAQDITCTPASLEELFLRHYQVAPR